MESQPSTSSAAPESGDGIQSALQALFPGEPLPPGTELLLGLAPPPPPPPIPPDETPSTTDDTYVCAEDSSDDSAAKDDNDDDDDDRPEKKRKEEAQNIDPEIDGEEMVEEEEEEEREAGGAGKPAEEEAPPLPPPPPPPPPVVEDPNVISRPPQLRFPAAASSSLSGQAALTGECAQRECAVGVYLWVRACVCFSLGEEALQTERSTILACPSFVAVVHQGSTESDNFLDFFSWFLFVFVYSFF